MCSALYYPRYHKAYYGSVSLQENTEQNKSFSMSSQTAHFFILIYDTFKEIHFTDIKVCVYSEGFYFVSGNIKPEAVVKEL